MRIAASMLIVGCLLFCAVAAWPTAQSDNVSSDEVETIDTTSGVKKTKNTNGDSDDDGVLRIGIVHSPGFGFSFGDQLSDIFRRIYSDPVAVGSVDSDEIAEKSPANQNTNTKKHDNDDDGLNIDVVYSPNFGQTPSSSYNPFTGYDFGFANSMSDIMRHLIFSTRGQDEESDSDDSDSIADTFPGLFPAHIPPVESNPSPPAEDQNETTSTIKIINGQKYRINDTIITRRTSFGSFISKVRRVELLDESTTDEDDESVTGAENVPELTTSTTEVAAKADANTAGPLAQPIDGGSPEEYEPEHNNEIDDGFQVEHIESFMEPQPDYTNSKYEVYVPEVVDLRGDTYVNQLMADQGAPINPYAEFLGADSSAEFMGEHRQHAPASEFGPDDLLWDHVK